MGNLHEFIFGQPMPAVIGLGILTVLLSVYAWRARGWVRLAPIGPAALAGLLLIADAAVQTDREKIEQILALAVERVQANQWPLLGELMDDEFEWRLAGSPLTSGRDQTLQTASLASNRRGVETVRLESPQLVILGDSATVDVAVRFAAGGRKADSKWRIVIRRDGDGNWRMISADMLSVNGHAIRDLPTLLM